MKQKSTYLALMLGGILATSSIYAQCPATAPAALTVPACSGTAVTPGYAGHSSGTYTSTGTVNIGTVNIFQDGGTLLVCSGTLTITSSNIFLGFNNSTTSTTPINVVVASGATLNIVSSNLNLYSSVNITNYGTLNLTGSTVSFAGGYQNSAIVNAGTINSNGAFNVSGTDDGIVNNGTMSASSITYNNGTNYTCLGGGSTLSVGSLTNAGTSHAFFTATGASCVKLSGTYTTGGAGNVISSNSAVKVCSSSATTPTAADAGAAVVSYSCSSCSSIPLPVVLSSFKATLTSEGVKVDFMAANENNIASYNVEKSKDARQFISIGRIAAKNGENMSYSLTDAQPSYGDNYYRLRINGLDGESHLSETILINVNAESNTGLNIYPNPAKDIVYVSDGKGNMQLSILDAMGRKCYAGSYSEQGVHAINISTLPAGMYMMRVEFSGKTQIVRFTKSEQE